ncbi:MAG: lipoprotein, partial [Prevotella sp.]
MRRLYFLIVTMLVLSACSGEHE